MELKKSRKANLETRRNTHILVGLAVSLAFVWTAFEYKSYDSSSEMFYTQTVFTEDDDFIIQTDRQKEVKPPEVKVITKILIIDNPDVEVPDIEFTAEIGMDDPIEDQFLVGDDIDEYDEKKIFVTVEDNPVFPGGEEALLRYLGGTRYPQMAVESGTQGIVHTSFVVEKDGSISNVELVRGIGNGCDEEALRMITNMPNWSPGKQRGLPVRVRYIVPIRFVLQEN